jgi:hypothetical protein
VNSAAPLAAAAQLGPTEPGEEAHHRREVGGVDEPVAGVREEGHCPSGYALAARYWLPWESSQSARLVKPTITASIQYCERTASLTSE